MALGIPSRAQLFARLAELRRPASTEELAEVVGLHPNGVRVHLGVLHAAGLIARERERQARGRPRDMWTVVSDALPAEHARHAYVDLSRWLASAIAHRATGIRMVERAGRRVGRELVPRDAHGKPAERLAHALSELGFAPRNAEDDGAMVRFRLCNCPYDEVVAGQREVVCALHRGVTRGLLDACYPGSRLALFEPRSSRDEECLLAIGKPRERVSMH